MSEPGDDAAADVSLPLAPGLSESLVEEAAAAVGDLFEGPGGGAEHVLGLDPHMHSHRDDPGPLGQDVSVGRMGQVGHLLVFWRDSLTEGGTGRPWKIVPLMEFSTTPFRIQRNLKLTLDQRMNEGRWVFRGTGEEVAMNCFARIESGIPMHRARAQMQPVLDLFAKIYADMEYDAHGAYLKCAARFPEGLFLGYTYPDSDTGKFYHYLMGGELADIRNLEKELSQEDDSQELHSELLAVSSQAPEDVATQMPGDPLATSTENTAATAASEEDEQVYPPPESQEDLFELVKVDECAGGSGKKTPAKKGDEDDSDKSGAKSPAAKTGAKATAGTSRGGGGGAGKDDSDEDRDRGKKPEPKGKSRRDSSEDSESTRTKKKSPGKKRAKSDDSDGEGGKSKTPKKKPSAGTKAALQEENERNKAELERKDELVQSLLHRLAENELAGAKATATRDEAAVEHSKAREDEARKEREDNERIRREGEAQRREAEMHARAAIEETQRKAREAREEQKRRERQKDEAETEKRLKEAREKREAEVRRAKLMREKAEREELQRRRMADEDSSEDDEPAEEPPSGRERGRASTAPAPLRSSSVKEPSAASSAPMSRTSSTDDRGRKGEKSKGTSSQPRKRHSCAAVGQPPCRCETLSLDQIRTSMVPGVPMHEIGHMLAFGLVQLEDTVRSTQADTTGAVGRVQKAIESRDPQLSELKTLTIKGSSNTSYKPVTKDDEDDLGIPFATHAEFMAALNDSSKREKIRCLLPQVKQSDDHFCKIFFNKIFESQLAMRYFNPSDFSSSKTFERFKYTEEHFVMPQVFCDMVVRHMRDHVQIKRADHKFGLYVDQQRKDRRAQFRMHFWKHLEGRSYPNFDNKVLWMVFVCNLRGWTFLDKYPAPIYNSSGVAEVRAYWERHRKKFEDAVKEHYGSMYDVPPMERPKRIYTAGARSRSPEPAVPEPSGERSRSSSE